MYLSLYLSLSFCCRVVKYLIVSGVRETVSGQLSSSYYLLVNKTWKGEYSCCYMISNRLWKVNVKLSWVPFANVIKCCRPFCWCFLHFPWKRPSFTWHITPINIYIIHLLLPYFHDTSCKQNSACTSDIIQKYIQISEIRQWVS